MNHFTGADGLVYNLSKIRQADIIEFHKWVQFKPYFDFVAMKDKIDPADYDGQTRILLEKCAEKSKVELSKEADAWQASIEGITYILYLSLRRNHPHITEESIHTIITDDNLREVNNLLEIMNKSIGPSKKNSKVTPAAK